MASVFHRSIVCLSISLLVVFVGACGTDSRSVLPSSTVRASTSSSIALSRDGASLWVANPDANTVTRVDTESLRVSQILAVGEEPWAVSVTPRGDVIVMNRVDGTLSFIHEGRVAGSVYVGAEPGGLALSPSGHVAYVTLSAEARVAVVDVQRREVVSHIAVREQPWMIAVTNDGDEADADESVIVTHRLAMQPTLETTDPSHRVGFVSVIPPSQFIEVAEIGPYSFGFPNALDGLATHSGTMFVTHLLNDPTLPRAFNTTVSGGVSTLSLDARHDLSNQRIHLNHATFSTPVNYPSAIAVAGGAKRLFVTLAGSNLLMGIDRTEPENPKLIGFWPTGANPRGLVLNVNETRAYVMNYLTRDVSVLDLTDEVNRREIARVNVSKETLAPEILRGKQLFHRANDPRISRLGWMSCASCHLDGGTDGTTWIMPDGPRQTIPLWRLDGTAPFHASATRDEVQDVEADIESLMEGYGLAPAEVNPLLGEPNGGNSDDLDALASFLLNGIRAPRSPNLDPVSVERGREVFATIGCTDCHSGVAWTISQLPDAPGSLGADGPLQIESALFDVGTFEPATDILGSKGFDVPSLIGLHASAPYLHNGSAARLEDVLANREHNVVSLSPQDELDLVTFLRLIDDRTVPFAEESGP